MSKMKKLLAMFLALTMVLGMSISTMASDSVPTKPTADNHEVVTVTNVEAGSNLTAYQIIDAYYGPAGDRGFVEYRWLVDVNDDIKAGDKVEFGTDNNIIGLNDGLVTDVAKNPGTLPSVTSTDATKIDLTVGVWVVLVTPVADALKIYNPMLASVYYTQGGSDATVAPGNINAGDSWGIATVDAYAKSSTISINKVFSTEDTDTAYETEHLDWVAFDDVITYKVTTTVPDYSDEYTTAVFTIEDNMDEGLELDADSITIKANGEELDAENYTLTTDTNMIKVEFKPNWVLNTRNAAIEIEYDVTVTDSATLNAESNDNEVVLTYTNAPNSTDTTEAITVKAYTFATDGDITKVKEDGTTALPGATFTLTNNATNKEYTAVSGSNGDVYFKGLDVGTYTLKETAAPAGYTINETEYTVTVSAEYDETGKVMESYAITFLNENNETVDTITITNTKLVSLPSTGGIGTTMFTIGGCGIMIAAAYLFFVSRRREEA